MRYLIPIMLLAGLATFSFAGDIYVDDVNGDDGNGGTSWADAKKTIGAGWGVASDGDIIHIAEGTYDMDDEASNYLKLWADKGVTFQGEKVSGGTTDRTATIIAGSSDSASYCVYVGDCDTYSITLKDLTISPDTSNDYAIWLRSGADYAADLTLDNVLINAGATNACIRGDVQAFGRTNQTLIVKNGTSITANNSVNVLNVPDLERLVIVDSSLTYVNGYGVLLDGVIADTNIVNCTFTCTGTGKAISGGFDGPCDVVKITDNTFVGTGSGVAIPEFVFFILIESNTFTNTNNTTGQSGFILGNDSQNDTNPIATSYILNNTLIYNGSKAGHVLMAGGGADGCEVAYNTVYAPSDNAGCMGIVVKAEYTNIHHNFIHAHRGILLKGAYGNKVHHNTVYLDGGNTPLYGLQWVTDTDYPQYNMINNNIFDARNGTHAICMISGGWDGGPTDVHSNNRLNYNCYVAGSEGLAYDGEQNHATLLDLRNKWASWSGLEFINNDANSIEADPQFVDANSGDLRLNSTSPCLNAGKPTAQSGYTSTGAWQGVSRSVLLPDNCADWVEMDFNNDCKVDFHDFYNFCQHWLECNLDPPEACWD